MPRMLVVCMTSTEKLGNQLAMRDPVRKVVKIYNQIVTDEVTNVNLKQLKISPWIGLILTIKVEEVIVLVDVWSGICNSSDRDHVLFHTCALLLVPLLAFLPTDV